MDLIKGLVNLNLILFLCAFSFKHDTMWMQSVSLLTNFADNMTAHRTDSCRGSSALYRGDHQCLHAGRQ